MVGQVVSYWKKKKSKLKNIQYRKKITLSIFHKGSLSCLENKVVNPNIFMTVIKLLWIAHYIISKIKFKSKFVKYTNQGSANKGQTYSGKAQGRFP